MSRLVICCDGTWSTLPNEANLSNPSTNVAKLFACLDADAPEQTSYYHPGLGTSGGPLSRLASGALGRGLGKSILTAYLWLADNYEESSDIFLLGYSRGAYTVRSLAGMLRFAGLLKFSGEGERERWRQAGVAYRRGYRGRAPRGDWADEKFAFHNGTDTAVPIRFIGVWDTVGALGIPNNLALLNLFDSSLGWAFHDTTLGPDVESARHALALDERRASFTPTIWRRVEGRDVKQHWFIGSHADVGGGHRDANLSNISLQWMIEEAKKSGVSFSPEKCSQLTTDSLGKIHDSLKGIFLRLRTRPRAVPQLTDDSTDVHASVTERVQATASSSGPYRPTRTLSDGEARGVDVFANSRWNETGLFLRPGNYVFSAEGHWTDGTLSIGPAGAPKALFRKQRLRYILSGLWGYTERAWRAVTGNAAADFWYTRRLENVPWMALVGVIANDNGHANPDNDGSPRPHERFLIGEGTEWVVSNPGYLYAFANDIWSSYDENRGSVRLTVTRVAVAGQ